MNKPLLSFTIAVLLAASLSGCGNGDKPSWKLGLQTYTFNRYTLMETLDFAKALNLKYAEAFFFQRLGEGFPDTAYLNFDLADELKTRLKQEFESRGIILYSSGVAYYDKEADWRRFFRFASEMGMKVVTVEPALKDLDLVESLAVEYHIRAALHNHPEPSVYANPDVVVKALEGRGRMMGVCADIGHWYRSGYDPLATVKRLEGRIMVAHFKELSPEKADVPWGTGAVGIRDIVAELRRQNFDGLISVEYEYFGEGQMDGIRQSLDYFNRLASPNDAVALMNELDPAAAPNTLANREKKASWQLLFDGRDPVGWHGYNLTGIPDCWTVEDGCLTMTTRGGGESQDIVTNRTWRNFALSLEFKLTKGANSGIIFQVKEDPKYKYPYETGPEFQVIDHENWPDPLEDWQICGANYAMYPPRVKPFKPLGEWNQALLVVDGNHVTQVLNGAVVVEYDKGTPEWNRLKDSGKWLAFPDWGKFDEGCISLQNHGTQVWYRSIKIKEL